MAIKEEKIMKALLTVILVAFLQSARAEMQCVAAFLPAVWGTMQTELVIPDGTDTPITFYYKPLVWLGGGVASFVACKMIGESAQNLSSQVYQSMRWIEPMPLDDVMELDASPVDFAPVIIDYGMPLHLEEPILNSITGDDDTWHGLGEIVPGLPIRNRTDAELTREILKRLAEREARGETSTVEKRFSDSVRGKLEEVEDELTRGEE